MNKYLFINIIIGVIVLYLIFLLFPPLDVGWVNDILPNEMLPEDDLEGFCIRKSKLISRGLTIKECQNACINRPNCRYTNTLKNIDGDKRGPCYISYGVGKQKKTSGCDDMQTWENKKYTVKGKVPAINHGASPFGGYYRRCWWTRHRHCRRWWWWRWRCWYGRWHRHCRRYRRRGLSRKLKKGEGDCDRNSDCEGRLKCKQRSRGPVPGVDVRGHPRTHDYCYDPSDTNV